MDPRQNLDWHRAFEGKKRENPKFWHAENPKCRIFGFFDFSLQMPSQASGAIHHSIRNRKLPLEHDF